MLNDTELRLSFWRDGSTKAERLAAAALRLSGYEEIDPQSPLGGPDGKKDILCRKGGLTWVGAVYFPIGPTRFSAIKKKYQSDLAGAPAGLEGFVFVTNQTLTPTQRKVLTDLARVVGKEVDILHLQQLVNLFDTASGYGVRIQYLGIPMSIEEQLSWSVDSDSQTAKALAANTRELLALRASVDRINTDQSQIIRTLGLALPTSAATPDLISVSSFRKSDGFPLVSAELSPALILLFHRLTCFDLPSRAVGQLRTNQVWLGNSDGRRATHVQPPPAEEVEGLLAALCDEWNAGYHGLRSHVSKLQSVATFHARFLLVHPFLDGNGRVARAILMQQCLDLFGRADMTLMNKGADYYSALQVADSGDTAPLVALIDPVVRG
jgi:fido (protein-threonine AMPylation protein)